MLKKPELCFVQDILVTLKRESVVWCVNEKSSKRTGIQDMNCGGIIEHGLCKGFTAEQVNTTRNSSHSMAGSGTGKLNVVGGIILKHEPASSWDWIVRKGWMMRGKDINALEIFNATRSPRSWASRPRPPKMYKVSSTMVAAWLSRGAGMWPVHLSSVQILVRRSKDQVSL